MSRILRVIGTDWRCTLHDVPILLLRGVGTFCPVGSERCKDQWASPD